MDSSTIAQRRDRLVTREIGGDTVVVPLATKPEDLTSIYIFNAVGAFVWAHLDGKRRLDEILRLVMDAFDEAPADEVARDVAAFLDELASLGLISFETAPVAQAAQTRAPDGGASV